LDTLITRILQGLVILVMPVLLVMTVSHLLINVWYLNYEYGKSDFPPDTYGFTQQQRLDLATVSIRFLKRRESPEVAIGLLEAQRLPGTDEPLFDQSEISHMLDVKRFTDALWRVQYVAGLILIGALLLLLARKGTRLDGYRALFLGGAWTVGLLAFLVILVLLSWRIFFVTFHELFFPPGTWTFDWNSSLIRLYPDRLWFDGGTIITVGTLLAGAVVATVGYRLGRAGSKAGN